MKTVGIIGTGSIAAQIHLPVLLAMDDVRVGWIADRDFALARSVGQMYGVPACTVTDGVEALPRVDVVLLAIPLPPREQYFNYFKDTSTALLVEKPLANDANEHRRLIKDFPDWKLSVGYQRRYYGSFRVVQSFIKVGTLGKLKRICVSEGGRTTRTEGGGQYQSLPVSAGGGLVKNLGCHTLDLAVWLSNAKTYTVRRKQLAWDGDTDQRCDATVDLKDKDGRIVELDFSVSWIDRMENRMDFLFETGILSCPIAPVSEIELKDMEGKPLASLSVSGINRAILSRQAFYLEWRQMLDALHSNMAQPISAATTLLTAELMDSLLDHEEAVS